MNELLNYIQIFLEIQIDQIKKHLEIFYKKKEKIKQNPLRLKHLSGGDNCYREEITKNIRLIYYIENNVVWFLTIGKHDKAYEEYLKRLHSLRNKLNRK